MHGRVYVYGTEPQESAILLEFSAHLHQSARECIMQTFVSRTSFSWIVDKEERHYEETVLCIMVSVARTEQGSSRCAQQAWTLPPSARIL